MHWAVNTTVWTPWKRKMDPGKQSFLLRHPSWERWGAETNGAQVPGGCKLLRQVGSPGHSPMDPGDMSVNNGASSRIQSPPWDLSFVVSPVTPSLRPVTTMGFQVIASFIPSLSCLCCGASLWAEDRGTEHPTVPSPGPTVWEDLALSVNS